MKKLVKYRTWLRKQLWQSWRSLLRCCRTPLLPGPKASRRRYCGKLGFHSIYILHSGVSQTATPDQQVAALLKTTERRFQEGHFFSPVARQVEATGAIVSARIQQGEGEERVDHVLGVFREEWQ